MSISPPRRSELHWPMQSTSTASAVPDGKPAKELPTAGSRTTIFPELLDVRAKAAANEQAEEDPQVDPSVAAFEARAARKRVCLTLGKKLRIANHRLCDFTVTPVGAIKRSGRALRLDLTDVDDAFAEWLDARAQDVLEELHDRWKGGT